MIKLRYSFLTFARFFTAFKRNALCRSVKGRPPPPSAPAASRWCTAPNWWSEFRGTHSRDCWILSALSSLHFSWTKETVEPHIPGWKENTCRQKKWAVNKLHFILPCVINIILESLLRFTHFYGWKNFSLVYKPLNQTKTCLMSFAEFYMQNKFPIIKWVNHYEIMDVSWVQLGGYLNAERQERSKTGSNARGQAWGDITLAWLREASPSRRCHGYPAGFVWRWAQLQRMISPMSSGCLTAAAAHLFKTHLCSCHSVTVWSRTRWPHQTAVLSNCWAFTRI